MKALVFLKMIFSRKILSPLEKVLSEHFSDIIKFYYIVILST